ncbi:hypothetical protein EGR_06566 [Echinococcus granulosus]|uniref:Uncharacterized protein n=1 Tax=Echinococcus granulosus TaxID=6210 RepID=W6UYD9_ECHGR|nr:hypothetical protein EGR_06566 [Echinococcus granulosus]EUB58579.1 hypothetical protein EGR_06566 [Echinococcus granulosus]
MAARYQESYGVSSVVPSLSVQPKVGCCRKVSMCCCSCCLAVSAILTIVFFVAGGILVYMNRDNDLITEEIRDLFDNDFRPTEGRVMWKGIGISLLVFGGIMSLLVFITGGFLCCLTPTSWITSRSACSDSLRLANRIKRRRTTFAKRYILGELQPLPGYRVLVTLHYFFRSS